MKFAFKLAIVGTLLLLPSLCSFAAGKQEVTRARVPQPLTYANIVKHFKDSGLRATEVQKRCTIFFEGEWKHADQYNYCLIIVENSDEDVQVTFYLTDAHEMNWVTEFLDAPFMAKNETQELFTLVNGHKPNQTARMGRYRVEFHHWEPKHAEIFVFSFTPSQR